MVCFEGGEILLVFLFLSLRTHRAYGMHHFLRNNQGTRKRWFAYVFVSILANAQGLQHASLPAKQSRHAETLVGRMRKTRNTRSASYPQRCRKRRLQIMTVCILESYWVGAHAARVVHHTI